jgi:hypothetical protein
MNSEIQASARMRLTPFVVERRRKSTMPFGR